MLLMMDAERSVCCTEKIQIGKHKCTFETAYCMLQKQQATELTMNVFFFFLTHAHRLNHLSFINLLFAYASPVSY